MVSGRDMSTIGARGEVTIVAGDKQYRILFTNRALADAERATGKTILQLVRGAAESTLGVEDTAKLLWVGMEAARRDARMGGRAYTLSDAWDVLDNIGFVKAATDAINAIAEVISWSPSDPDTESSENPPS